MNMNNAPVILKIPKISYFAAFYFIEVLCQKPKIEVLKFLYSVNYLIG